MKGRSVYHDRDEEVVVVIDEEGEVVRRIDAEDAKVIVNEYTVDFLVAARTPEPDAEKRSVKVFNQKGELKLKIEIEDNVNAPERERIIGTFGDEVITYPTVVFGPPMPVDYEVFVYDHNGERQTLIEKANAKVVEVSIYGRVIVTFGPGKQKGMMINKYNSEGKRIYTYSPQKEAIRTRYSISSDGRHMLTWNHPEGERHRRNFKLHIEGRDPIEWEAEIPRSPTIFWDDEEIIVYREWPQREYPVAYTYDGRKLWSVRNTAHSIAVHEVGRRSLVSSLELKEGVPRIAHYSLEEGTLLGVSALGQYVNKDEEKLENVPEQFYADDEGNLLLPIGDKYVIVEFDKGG